MEQDARRLFEPIADLKRGYFLCQTGCELGVDGGLNVYPVGADACLSASAEFARDGTWTDNSLVYAGPSQITRGETFDGLFDVCVAEHNERGVASSFERYSIRKAKSALIQEKMEYICNRLFQSRS